MQITLDRVEGPYSELGVKTADSFEAADSILKEWAKTAPDRGYDKIDVNVKIDDLEWVFRFDLKSCGTEGDGLNFESNLRNRLAVYAGRKCPPHMTKEGYSDMIATLGKRSPGFAKLAAEVLEKISQ